MITPEPYPGFNTYNPQAIAFCGPLAGYTLQYMPDGETRFLLPNGVNPDFTDYIGSFNQTGFQCGTTLGNAPTTPLTTAQLSCVLQPLITQLTTALQGFLNRTIPVRPCQMSPMDEMMHFQGVTLQHYDLSTNVVTGINDWIQILDFNPQRVAAIMGQDSGGPVYISPQNTDVDANGNAQPDHAIPVYSEIPFRLHQSDEGMACQSQWFGTGGNVGYINVVEVILKDWPN